MIKYIRFAMLLAICTSMAACASADAESKQEPYRKKIYLTEQDYLDDLEEKPYSERREAKPNTESDYIFNVQPPTQKNVYFFDDRVRPLVPGEPSERDYKNTKRLWKKPRRYEPQEYYGDEAAPAADNATTDSYSNGDNFDYD